MAPLEGNTLGERHWHYNKLVKQAIDEKQHFSKIDYNEDDVDNMMKIDIASHNRDVDYILEVLQCDDMLYVTRAIKKSTWLVTEQQYSHIINPRYLHTKVFPSMIPKAIIKLMLHIRKHLKDDKRLKAFYNYVCKTNPKQALKWLPTCSIEFLAKTVKKRTKEIPLNLTKRIAKRSKNILKYMIKAIKSNSYYDNKTPFYRAIFLLRNHTDEFLEILDSDPNRQILMPVCASTTAILMRKAGKKIMDNFLKYISIIHLPTFVKFIKGSDIKDFLITNSSSSWLYFDNLQHFLEKLPHYDDMLEFLKLLFGLRSDIKTENDKRSDAEVLFYAIEPVRNHDSFKNICRWYRFAPFKIAFKDIKKFICAESSPEERHSMIITLLTNASKNMDHVTTVLEYYHERHINEPYLHKIQFVNSVLTQHDAFRFNDNLWNKINELFHSLEVYVESNNKVQLCIHNIIIYNVIRGQEVPDTVEDKFEFNSMKQFKQKLNNDEQDKLFRYLNCHLLKKLNNEKLGNESSMNKAISILKDFWTLIKDWEKQVALHKFIIQKILDFCDVNTQNGWDISMTHLYYMMKSYQRPLTEISIRLYPCEDVLLNILRHNPQIFDNYKEEINEICCNNEISLKRLLCKLRIYFSESIATKWGDLFAKNINKIAGHRAIVRGIFVFNCHSKIIDFIKTYAPTENRINWSEYDETVLSLRKHIAKSMHLVRPQLPTEIILWYATGDYLQYAVHSLNTVYHNLRSNDIKNQIHALLNAPVSLQKHGIRLAFSKYKTKELLLMSEKIWRSNRNSTIRVVIFTSLFDLLCKQKKTTLVDSVWKILRSCIDDLNQDENIMIYQKLQMAPMVPLRVVGQFYQSSFLYLEPLPPKAKCKQALEGLVNYATKFIEYFENNFVENSLLGSVGVYNILASNKQYPYIEILSAYLLCSKDENVQLQKYNNLLTPALEKWSSSWVTESEIPNLDGLDSLLNYIGKQIDRFVFNNKMIMPVMILTKIKDLLCSSLSITDHYIMLTHWKLSVKYINLLNDYMILNPAEDYSWDRIRAETTKDFAEICVNLVENDCAEYFSRMYNLVADALRKTFWGFGIDDLILLNILKSMLDCNNIEVYLTVLNLAPTRVWGCEKEILLNEIYKKLYLYPSKELRMYYFQKRKETYHNDTKTESCEESDNAQGDPNE